MSDTPGFDAFDEECRLFEESLTSNQSISIPLGTGGLDLEELGDILAEIQASIQGFAPSNARRRAQQLLDMYHVLKAARGICNDRQAAIYAQKIHLLHIEYDKAANAALSGSDYGFSADLKSSAKVLMDAYKQVQQNISAMNMVASAMNGAASLIGALV